METYNASIFKGEKLLLENIQIYLELTTDQAGFKSWYGAFQLSSNQIIDTGGPYRIELDDGRSGDILIRSVTVSSYARTQVSFVGTGPLE